MFGPVIVVNIFIAFVFAHPLNYGGHSPEFYNSLNPQQRYQRSFPGFYSNGMFQQQSNPVFHTHPMDINNRPLYRRNIYENSGFRPQFEQQSPVGLYGPSSMQQSKSMTPDESRLIVLPRGADEEYAMYPLKTKMIEGFDEEDHDMMQEEEMGDALSYIDSQTPTRYTSERILKPPKHSAPSLHMEMAPPSARMSSPSNMGYNLPPAYGNIQAMPQQHMMMPHPENYQRNYQTPQFESENMYSSQNYHHQHQKRYQPHHQYYQNSHPSRFTHPFENPYRFFETPKEEMMYSMPTKNVYSRAKINSKPQEVILADEADDNFYDDDEMVVEDTDTSLSSDDDNTVRTDDSNPVDVSSNEDESDEITIDDKQIDDEKNDENTTSQPEYDDAIEDEDNDLEVSKDQDEQNILSSED